MKKFTLSIDWEDFGQLACRKYYPSIKTEPVPGCIERQTGIILDLLDETGQKGTFFILGMLAKSRPSIVNEIIVRGHEIGLHGLNHEVMSSLSFSDAYRVLEDAKKCVEDISGVSVYGYRAPIFSINKSNLYLFNVLAELGFIYDSSICPVKMSRYGIDSFVESDTVLKLQNGNEIVEIPLSIYTLFGRKFPVSGGGYMRLMPKEFVYKVYQELFKKEIAGIIYMHPYEFDNKLIDISSNFPKKDLNLSVRICVENVRWNIFRNSIISKIRYLLNRYEFITAIERAVYVKKNTVGKKILELKK
jgi:polysaccharide deacetylase family protein (PEP-CTERM system associated)